MSLLHTEERTKLNELRIKVERKYLYSLSVDGDDAILWKLILECIELIIAFVIAQGTKIKWYNPLVIWEALKTLKKIVDLVIEYLNKN